MLEGLDDIPWSKLHHAYGSAEDVPGSIRDLASTKLKVADTALSDLFGNIWHQNTVYEATSHAVPFLVELLVRPETLQRHLIIMLLESIASGTGYHQIHHPGHPEIANEAIHTKRAHDAVGHHLEDFIRLRTDADPIVGRHLPALLAAIPPAHPWLRGNALTESSRTKDAFTSANWLFALSYCCSNEPHWTELVDAIGHQEHPVVRLAINHLKFCSGEERVVRTASRDILSIFRWPGMFDAYYESGGFLHDNGGSLEEMFIHLVERVPAERARHLIGPACEIAPNLGDITAEMICTPLLSVAFGEPAALDQDELTREQRVLLQQVARTTNVYHAEPVSNIFKQLQNKGVLARIGIKPRQHW